MEGIYRPSGAGKCAPILVKHHLQPHRHRPLLAPARPLPSPPRLLRRMPRLQSRLPRLQSRLPLDLAAAMVSRSPAPGASAPGNSPRRLPRPQRTLPPPARRRLPRFPTRLLGWTPAASRRGGPRVGLGRGPEGGAVRDCRPGWSPAAGSEAGCIRGPQLEPLEEGPAAPRPPPFPSRDGPSVELARRTAPVLRRLRQALRRRVPGDGPRRARRRYL